MVKLMGEMIPHIRGDLRRSGPEPPLQEDWTESRTLSPRWRHTGRLSPRELPGPPPTSGILMDACSASVILRKESLVKKLVYTAEGRIITTQTFSAKVRKEAVVFWPSHLEEQLSLTTRT